MVDSKKPRISEVFEISGNSFEFKSTLAKESIHLDVCDKCHPFYTGKQRIVDTGGRVDRFNKRFGALSSKK
ncbi:50S ribosomal protein L31 [Vibrio rotiferianus]|uniref:50S ribosomal protein L31 n=1 Tax=Vibrio rotiferianus TaxID=190895 RepID=UPI001110104A|nr:50S ribosomal protein L31 [Vibrio rotiferianus]TMX38273.1 50S ribosomal protein L31 [Vibrio rotiferianus]